jgi:ribosomal protein S7
MSNKLVAPPWCSHAIPTYRGWEDPKTGELFASRGFTQSQIDEFHGKKEEVLIEVAPVIEEEISEEPIEVLTEAPANHKPLEKMTKIQLESLGRQHGVELDRRKNKKSLVATMKRLLKD